MTYDRFDKIASKIRDRTRERHSYQQLQHFSQFLGMHPTKYKILKHMLQLIDNIHGFGTAQRARWYFESLELLAKDDNLK